MSSPAPALRVGVFSYDYQPAIGGGGRRVVEICKRLDADRVHVFSGRVNALPNHTGPLRGMRHGFLKQSLLSFWLNLELGGVVREFGLGRIHVHGGPGGLFLLRRPPVPLVVTAHHTYLQQARRIGSQFWKRVFVPFERRTMRLAERVICVSEDTRSVVVESYGIPADRTAVIPNGVDLAAFRPLPGTEKIAKSVLFLSRLEKRKGVDFLVRSMRHVANEDPAVRLYVGGMGSMEGSLKRLVGELGLQEQVSFLGFLPDDEVNGWYNRVSGFVMPSMFEGFGIPVIEAMAAGTPVIGTDVDGIRGLIQHEETGLLVPFGDEAKMAEAILRVCRGGFQPPPGLSERIRRDYDWDDIARRYRELLFA